ncbi:unnamed protein product, partial [Discosporangium mesarthrocarpum]
MDAADSELHRRVRAVQEAVKRFTSGPDSARLQSLAVEALSILSTVKSDREGTRPQAANGDHDDLLHTLSNLALGVQSLPSVGFRVRESALSTLELGVRESGGGSDSLGFQILGAAAAAVDDSNCHVRAAAANVAGAFLQGGNGRRRLRDLLSTAEGCWLPALLVDGHPLVEEAAHQALVPPGPTHAPNAPSPSPQDAPDSSWAVAAVAAACRILETQAEEMLATRGEDPQGQEAGVRGNQNLTLRALRAIRSGLSGIGEPWVLRPAWGVVSDALDAIVSWLEGALEGPPGAPPWTPDAVAAAGAGRSCSE